MEKITKKKILVTGANGFLGFNFISKLKELGQYDIYEYCYFSTDKDLKRYCKDCDFVFHIAGVVKAKTDKEFFEGNVKLTKKLLKFLEQAKNNAPIIFMSSIWVENNPEHIYSRTKLIAENLLKQHATKHDTKVYIYRMNNLYGPHSEPNYGGVVMTFAYNIVHNLPITINDKNRILQLTYVEDLCLDFVDIINGKKHADNFYCENKNINLVSLEEIVKLLKRFNKNPNSEKDLKNDFEKKLHKTFMFYYNNLNSEKYKEITIIFCTCEKYRDTWDPYFKLLKKYGEGLTKCDIVFNSERTVYNDKDLNIISTASFKDMTGRPWGERLKLALSMAKTEYVLFVMEDYYLHKCVEGLEIIKCLDYLKKNKKIGSFNFESLSNMENESEEYPNFCLIPLNQEYRVNAQTSLWRKSILDKSILPEESPWDWEIYGNQRNRVVLKDIDFYCLKYGTKEPYFLNYYEKRTDWKGHHINRNGVMKGKWYISYIDPLFKENDIHVDYSKLGEYKPKYYKFSWIWHFLGKSTRKIRKCRLFNKKEYDLKKEKYDNLVKKYIENENQCK